LEIKGGADIASSFFMSKKEAIGMIKNVSIQLQSLICGGVAIVERNGVKDSIYFDVVKSHPVKVVVGNRGKQVTEEDADMYEKALLDLFLKHDVPLKIGTFAITA
jgi:hypothetical protein